jgi:hypothetical protein
LRKTPPSLNSESRAEVLRKIAFPYVLDHADADELVESAKLRGITIVEEQGVATGGEACIVDPLTR